MQLLPRRVQELLWLAMLRNQSRSEISWPTSLCTCRRWWDAAPGGLRVSRSSGTVRHGFFAGTSDPRFRCCHRQSASGTRRRLFPTHCMPPAARPTLVPAMRRPHRLFVHQPAPEVRNSRLDGFHRFTILTLVGNLPTARLPPFEFERQSGGEPLFIRDAAPDPRLGRHKQCNGRQENADWSPACLFYVEIQRRQLLCDSFELLALPRCF
jgi:hypothetical protein